MSENYSIANQTTGQAKLMYAKILTGGFASNDISQTCIQNPILFPNPLGKLDKLDFKIYLDDAALTPLWRISVFQEDINEWDATFQIDEEIGFIDKTNGWDRNPTIPIPDNPSLFPYVGLTPNKKA